ncbi:MAG: hypothetical protein JSS09_10165 [Verrucomicrobia bacterium]|nr:hypothetical protein [Verrucomicrobiota bacterium]
MNAKTDWEEKVRQFQESKMSKAAWCRSQGIALSTFQRHTGANKEKTKPRFIELNSSFRGVRLKFKSAVFELEPDFDIGTLRRFLKALE